MGVAVAVSMSVKKVENAGQVGLTTTLKCEIWL